MKILRISYIIGDGICVDQYSTVIDRPQTRVWWSLPSSRSSSRDAGEDGEYSDIMVTGSLKTSDFNVDGHTVIDAVKVEIGTEVTSFYSAGVFYGCENLIEVSLPSTFNPATMGTSLFNNSTTPNLQRIVVSKDNPRWKSIEGIMVDKTTSTVYAFPKGKTHVFIPNDVTSLGNYSYAYLTQPTSIAIPNNVTSIGSGAFQRCTGLTIVTIPDSVSSIGTYVFYGCSGLTSVTIPDSVTSIGYQSFRDCSSLTSLTIPNSVTSIGQTAFQGCGELTNLTLPFVGTRRNEIANSYQNLLGYLFGQSEYEGGVRTECRYLNNGVWRQYYVYVPHNLTSVTITDATEVKPGAFYGWSQLTNITLNEGITKISECGFDGCSGITSITIPNSVTSIGYNAFSNCYKLTSITIPDSVTSIGSFAFSGCTNLTSVTIPDSVTSIEMGTFQGCNSLTSVTLGNGVTKIVNQAFYNCTRLALFDFHTLTQIPVLASTNAFYNTPSTKKIVVPDNLYESWKSATNWSSTTNNIVDSIVKYSEYTNT